MHAEQAYLFRHGLLREAAYQLQLPGDRAKLHLLAFELIEKMAGGRAPELSPRQGIDEAAFQPHPTDAFAAELAEQAGHAQAVEDMRVIRSLYLRRAAEHAERFFRADEAFLLWQSAAELLDGGDRGEALRRAAAGHISTGRTAPAESMFLQALQLFRGAPDRRFEGLALGNLAVLYATTGRTPLAEATHATAIAIHREVGNRRSEGAELGGLAALYYNSGRTDLSEAALVQALQIHRETGNRRSEGVELGKLAGLCHRAGRAGEAEAMFDRAIAIHREVSNRRFEALHRCDRALCLLTLGRPAQATLEWNAAFAMLRELGNGADVRKKTDEMREACTRAGVPFFTDQDPWRQL